MSINIILGMMGGLGLFIYGMHLLSDSLKNLSLGLLRTLLEKMTATRLKSIFVGFSVTAIIQSSSATSVLLVGFLNAGIISLAGSLAIMLGAHVGTTLTAQLIAFKLTTFAPVFVFVGAIIFFFAKKNKNKNKGLAFLGFGLLFLGLAMMSSSVKPLASNEITRNAFISFGKQPLLGILAGIIVTAILQSSSTTTGMIIAFASTGLLDFPSSLSLVFGANIGTCITAIIASIGGNLASKRLALGNTLFNILGTIIALAFIPLYLTYIPMISDDVARQVANAHSVFNIFNTIIIFPFLPLFVKLLHKMMPGADYGKRDVQYLDKNLLSAPNLAIRSVVKELSVMLSICQGMLEKARKCVNVYNHKLQNEITFDEDSVDEMQKHITEYIVEITKNELMDKQSQLIPSLIHSVNDVERVGDYCERIVALAQRAYENDLEYSQEAKLELETLFDKTEAIMRHTREALEKDDHEAARITLAIKEEISQLIMQDKLNHIKRLGRGVCIGDSGLVYTDLLTYIGRLNAHLSNVTKGILHIGKR